MSGRRTARQSCHASRAIAARRVTPTMSAALAAISPEPEPDRERNAIVRPTIQQTVAAWLGRLSRFRSAFMALEEMKLLRRASTPLRKVKSIVALDLARSNHLGR